MKKHIIPWLDHSWNMLQLCGTRTPKSELLKLNKSSIELPTGQSIILTNRPVQLGYYKNLDGEHWNKGVRMPAFACHGLAEVPLPAYVEFSGRNSRYPHSTTFRQVYTSRDYYIINTPFALLLLHSGMPFPCLLPACRTSKRLRLKSASCSTHALSTWKACFI